MNIRRFLLVSLAVNLLVPILLLSSCTKSDTFEWQPLYGTGQKDLTDVLAIIDDIRITEKDLETHYNELPRQLRKTYNTEEGKRLLLNRMVEQIIMVKGAVELELYRDPDVRATLISRRREALDSAMRNYGLLRGNEPSDEELRKFFEDNKDDYLNLAMLKARHIECLTQDEADRAYARLQQPGVENMFNVVCYEFTVNKATGKREGELGYFNKGGYLPDINGGMEFTNIVGDYAVGLHPPVEVAGRWHIVEVIHRLDERYQTYAEARDQVSQDMLPGYQAAIIRDYLLEKRRESPVQYFGRFAPGGGLEAEQLYERAKVVQDNDQKMELLRVIYTDFPDSDLADDALFMCATMSLSAWHDHRVGGRYLKMLLEQYPDSELAADAKIMNDNLHNPSFWNPKSIQDMKQ